MNPKKKRELEIEAGRRAVLRHATYEKVKTLTSELQDEIGLEWSIKSNVEFTHSRNVPQYYKGKVRLTVIRTNVTEDTRVVFEESLQEFPSDKLRTQLMLLK